MSTYWLLLILSMILKPELFEIATNYTRNQEIGSLDFNERLFAVITTASSFGKNSSEIEL